MSAVRQLIFRVAISHPLSQGIKNIEHDCATACGDRHWHNGTGIERIGINRTEGELLPQAFNCRGDRREPVLLPHPDRRKADGVFQGFRELRILHRV